MSRTQRIACLVMCVALAAIILGPEVPVEGSMRNFISEVKPVYPEMARRMGSSGNAKLELVIGTDGRVRSAKAMGGNPLFSAAAIDAARKSKYEVGMETTMVVEYRFAP